MKTCYKCHKIKPLSEFPEDLSRGYNKHYCCKMCKAGKRVRKHSTSTSTPKRRFKAWKAVREHAKLVGDHISRSDLYKRDGGICGICNKPVTRELFEMDHIFPLSKGGPHTWANVQIAHQSCNVRKGTKVMIDHPHQYLPEGELLLRAGSRDPYVQAVHLFPSRP